MNRSRKLKNLEPGNTVRLRLKDHNYILSKADRGWETAIEVMAVVTAVSFAADKHDSMVVLKTDCGEFWGDLETSIRLVGVSS
jgi:hypothetical protein